MTDAGSETIGYSSRVQVSKDNGGTWSYDTATDPVLTSGFRFDGTGRFFSFDVAGANSTFVTYENFSVTLLSPTWNGGGANNNWSTDGNWSRGVKPTAGEDVVFSGTTRQANVNDLTGLSINSLQLATAGFSLSGNPFTVVSAITNVTGNGTVNNNITFGGAVSVRTTAGNLTLGGNIDGTGSLTKVGNGILTLNGVNSHSGTTTVNAGTLLVNGSIAIDSAVSIAAAGTLGGLGIVSGTVSVTGTISPGNNVGTLTTGSETWNGGGAYLVELDNTTNDVINAASLSVVATSASKFNIGVKALEALTGWDGTTATNWTILRSISGISGLTNVNQFNVTNNFAESGNPLVNANYFSAAPVGNDLVLSYNLLNAAADGVVRNSGAAFEFSASTLLGNDTGTGLGVSAVSATSGAGGQVELGGGIIYYTPPANDPGISSDTFTYTLTDGNGQTANGTVTVTASGTPNRFLNMQTAGLIEFNAIPNTSYTIQYTDDIGADPVVWTHLVTVTSSNTGRVSYQDPGPLPPARYYRVVVPTQQPPQN